MFLQLNECLGKNNGTVKGKSYFKCDDNYGIFVRPVEVKVRELYIHQYNQLITSTPSFSFK